MISYTERQQRRIDDARAALEAAEAQVEMLNGRIAELEYQLAEAHREQRRADDVLNKTALVVAGLEAEGLHVPGPDGRPTLRRVA